MYIFTVTTGTGGGGGTTSDAAYDDDRVCGGGWIHELGRMWFEGLGKGFAKLLDLCGFERIEIFTAALLF